MDYPSKAILDGDILAYKMAFRFDTEGIDDDFEAMVDHQINDWVPEGVEEYHLALSCRRQDNFRRQYLPDYKAHRETADKPDLLGFILEYLTDTYPILTEPTLEADDIMGLNQHDTLTVTIDKDLKSVPGWLWNPDKDYTPCFISETKALGNLCLQWLQGDKTDNIPGIFRMGPKKSWDILVQAGDPNNWLWAVLATYEQKGYTLDQAMATYHGVYILRKTHIDPLGCKATSGSGY